MKATLQDVLVEELRDLLDAEKQLTKATPKMARSAEDSEVRQAFEEHLEQTKQQIQRLEQVFQMMDMRARSKPCAGMKGIIEESQEVQQEDFSEGIRDTALLGAGRRVEHYEIAAYTGVIEMAQQAGMRDAVQLLQQSLREEMEMEKRLAQCSKRLLKEAGRAAKDMGREEQAEGRGRGRGQSAARASNRAGRSSSARSQAGGTQGRRSASAGGGRGRSASARATSRRAPRGSQRNAGGSAHPLVDHDEIRQWAEERGGQPACVKGTGGGEDTGMIRLDFPGWTGEESLQPIDWDQWFEKFDDSNLALLVQDTTGSGEKSNFNKLVKREHAESRRGGSPKVKHAGE